MKPLALALLSMLLPLAYLAQEQEETPPKKKSTEPVTAFFQGEAQRLTEGVEGAWMLMDYVDPSQQDMAEAVDGFATFHDGFLTLIVAIQTFDTRLFHVADVLLLQTGAYRYRFDEQANLQLSSVLGYTSFTEDASLERERPGETYEYIVTLDDGVLELRTTEGVVFTFRRTEAGEFPESAIRAIEGRRSGQPHWEEMTNRPR